MWGTKSSKAVIEFADLLINQGYSGTYILDAGCGEGRHAIYLSKLGFKIYGVDISSLAIQKAKEWVEKEKVKDKITLKVGDVTKMECKDSTFDAAIDVNTINFITNKRKYIAEISRTLKRGGYLLIVCISEKNKAHGITKQEIRELLAKQFEILEIKEFWENIPQHQYKVLAKNCNKINCHTFSFIKLSSANIGYCIISRFPIQL